MTTPTYVPPDILAAEAREVLRKRRPETPRDHYTWLVRSGFINAKGEVTRLIGGSAEPEPDDPNWSPDEPPSTNGAS